MENECFSYLPALNLVLLLKYLVVSLFTFLEKTSHLFLDSAVLRYFLLKKTFLLFPWKWRNHTNV